MPMYEFVCESCAPNMIIELLSKVDDSPRCPDCDIELKRLTSAPRGYVKGSKTPVRQ